MRSTKSTTQALERLASAMDLEVTRDGKLFVVDAAPASDLEPLPKKSAAALAHLSYIAARRADWEALRQATRYDPGLRRGDLVPNVPTHGLSGWEEEYLTRLAVTERDQ